MNLTLKVASATAGITLSVLLFMLILDYISLQIPELQKEYANLFIKDCSEAYVEGRTDISCPQGVSERIIQTFQSILNLKQNELGISQFHL